MWPKLEVRGRDGKRVKIVELSEGAALGLSVNSLNWLATGAIHGTSLPDDGEVFRYTREDSARDAALELLEALKELNEASPDSGSRESLHRVYKAKYRARRAIAQVEFHGDSVPPSVESVNPQPCPERM